MKFFLLPNIVSDKLEQGNIESWKPKDWPKGLETKTQFSEWIKKPSTEWQFFSTYEGVNPSARVNASANPPWLMHGLVIDYDMPVEEDLKTTGEFFEHQCQRKGVPAPTYVCKTFSSNVRTVYLFEKPLLVHAIIHTHFLQQLTKDLQCRRIYQGLDENALKDTGLFYCSPLKWHKLDAAPIQTSFLMHCLVEASSKSNWKMKGAPAVPMRVIAEELQGRFPNRWQGPFDIGARGVRFWDDSADNHTAAIVRETGMQCFTGPKSFVTWAEIFGGSFVKDYENGRVGGAVEDVYFDGMVYWMKIGNEWFDFSRQDAQLQLRQRGLTLEQNTPGEMNEIEKALALVQTSMRVDAAVPIPHFPTGIQLVQGKRFLNIADTNLVLPASACKRWGDGFKVLAGYLDRFFDPIEGNVRQLDHYLSWLKRFYMTCREKRPRPGQVVFIAGEIQSGKTFMSNVVLAKLMGGSSDCSSYLLGETRFTGHLFSVPIWTIDDTRPGQDKAHANYSALVKKMAANQLFLYDDKFRRARMIPWLGRVVITCNLDNESLRILPDIEQSLLDKISLFKAAPATEGYDFGVLENALAVELPVFAKWLEDWEPPHETLEVSRFGVTSYHHPELLQAAKEVTSSHSFYEVFHMFMSDHFNTCKEDVWIGNASTMLKELSGDDGMRAFVSHYTPRAIGRFIAQLEGQGVPLTQIRQDGLRMWCLTKPDFEHYCATSQMTDSDDPKKSTKSKNKRAKKP